MLTRLTVAVLTLLCIQILIHYVENLKLVFHTNYT